MNSITKSNLLGLGVLIGLSVVLISITNHYILTLNFYDSSGDFLSGDPARENDIYNALQKYIYFSACVFTLVKLVIVSLIIYTALYLVDKETSFGSAFNIALYAEFIFLIPVILKIIWFKYEYPQGTVEDWHKVSVLSMLSISGNVSPDWYYPLQTLNIFEIAYWFLLARGIEKVANITYDQSLRVVIFSYVPALIIWVTVIAYCTVMTFPQNA